jgi:hypothetical protein
MEKPSMKTPASAMREESGELRFRCGRLRDHSRLLRQRSQQCRLRISHAAEGIEHAVAALSAGQETDGAAHRNRLTRAETDLQAAIAECSAALADVRRELFWHDPGRDAIVH